MTDSVSRETPPTPVEAAGVFSSALPGVERFAELLVTAGIERGLLGPREAPRLWERHLLNCGLLARAVPVGESSTEVADIGSGAGLPGMVLALTRPDLHLVLVEPLLRRTVFLEECVQELGLRNAEVVRARAEELHGNRRFAVVTSRAVARLDKLASWSIPLVRAPGDVVAMKGSSAATEVDETAASVRRLGGEVVGVEQYGADVVETPTTVVRIHVAGSPRGARGAGREIDQRRSHRRRGTEGR